MDPRFRDYSVSSDSSSLSSNITSTSSHGVEYDYDEDCDFSGPGLPVDSLLIDEDCDFSGPGLPVDSQSIKDDYDEDCDFSDAVLSYINTMLMEEDMDDKTCMLQESLELQAKEKSFYEVLGKKYPPSPENTTGGYISLSTEDPPSPENTTAVFSPASGEYSLTGLTERRSRYCEDVDVEENRSRKQAAICTDSPIRSEEFDIILLNSMGKGEAELKAYRTKLQDATRNGNGKSQGKKRNKKKKVGVDLSTLLINCAHAAATDDRRNANELLQKIRQHSSPSGDGNQRLAHCFADGLEARLAGMGSQIYKGLMSKVGSAADYLKAYHLYLASCPFKRISNFASNKTIMIKAEKATRVHIIDFGILYGFQWPTFIQRLAAREGGPPKLRITGIEFPQPGFRPAERIEETGQRLADYARTFDVPFEYNAIAKNWETIRIEDLKIDKDELLVVNSVYRFKNLHDETVEAESAKTVVLNLIRKINPDIFVNGIVNGAYSAPYFVTRFREALFHFSSLFDMLDTNVPREIPERTLIEREIFGREAMNVIACEGRERVERPETYKQWQVLHLRAGFKQVSFERLLMKKAIHKLRLDYHKDFLIDEDGKWLLLGWKGRIIYALSCWKPV